MWIGLFSGKQKNKTHYKHLLHLCADNSLDYVFLNLFFFLNFSPLSDEFDSLVQTLRTFWMFAQGSPPAGRSHFNFAAERQHFIRGSINAVWMFYMVSVDVSGSTWPQTPQIVCQSPVPTIGSWFFFLPLPVLPINVYLFISKDFLFLILVIMRYCCDL